MKLKYIKKKLNLVDINPKLLRGSNFYSKIVKSHNDKYKLFKNLIKKSDDFQCILCGNNKGKLYLSWKKYELYECNRCKSISPNIFIDNLYSDNVYNNKKVDYLIEEVVKKNFKYRKQTFGKERFEYCIKRLGISNKKTKILDVGCGYGYFLSYLKDCGFSPEGIEIDKKQILFCKKKQLNVSNKDIKNFRKSQFKLITMFNVLEHLIDPIDTMQNISNLLIKNGYIVAYIPNIHSVGFELMANKQNNLSPFEHLCFFNESSLKFLSKKTNLEILKIDYFGLDIMDYLLMKDYENNSNYNFELSELSMILQSCIDKLKISNHMRVTFIKK